MKKLYLLFPLLFLFINLSAQQVQTSIWGCKFGCNKTTVIDAIKKQGYEYKAKGDEIEVSNPRFIGRPFKRCTFSFYLDQMYSCEFSVQSDSDSVLDDYIRVFKKHYQASSFIDEYGDTSYFNTKGDYCLFFNSSLGFFNVVMYSQSLITKAVKSE